MTLARVHRSKTTTLRHRPTAPNTRTRSAPEESPGMTPQQPSARATVPGLPTIALILAVLVGLVVLATVAGPQSVLAHHKPGHEQGPPDDDPTPTPTVTATATVTGTPPTSTATSSPTSTP